jgi:hypothetical protein
MPVIQVNANAVAIGSTTGIINAFRKADHIALNSRRDGLAIQKMNKPSHAFCGGCMKKDPIGRGGLIRR